MISDGSKKYEVIVSATVYEDLNKHVYFLAQVSESAAVKLKEVLIRNMKSLEEMPYRHPAYERPWLPAGKYRNMPVINGQYRIIYSIAGDFVYIDAIEDCRENPTSP